MIDIDSLTIGEARQLATLLATLLGSSPAKPPSTIDAYIGVRAIIRCRDAGVHYGTVQAVDGRTVDLTNARRIWRWRGALTLSHLATESTPPLNHERTRIAPVVAKMPLLDACEILPLTSEAAARLDAVPPWTA